MADLEDLGYVSILDMSQDEAVDILRQIRLSRRTPEKKVKEVRKTKAPKPPAMNAVLAAKLLNILEDNNDD
jgi:hypothetical protein